MMGKTPATYERDIEDVHEPRWLVALTLRKTRSITYMLIDHR
jgi:hypothetical protein